MCPSLLLDFFWTTKALLFLYDSGAFHGMMKLDVGTLP